MATSGLRQRRKIGEDGDKSKAWSVSASLPLESFDLYQKVREPTDSIATNTGGTVSVIAVVVCLVLICAEVYAFLVPSTAEHIAVDNILEDRLRINFDITFPALTCAEVSLDAMDVAGEQQNGLDHDIRKSRLDANGVPIETFSQKIEQKHEKSEETPLPADYCGSCYGADAPKGASSPGCCNSCDELRSAYGEKGWDASSVITTAQQCIREHKNPEVRSKKGEGCRIAGFLLVNKVAGNFHIAMGETHTRGAGHIHQFNPQNMADFNVSHVINSLSFGDAYPGMKNPLDGRVARVPDGTGVFMYQLKVIPTTFDTRKNAQNDAKNRQKGGANSPNLIHTNQYSASTQYRPAIVHGQRVNVLPGVFFVYDISPFHVNVTRHSNTLSQLLTSLFAILGGVLSLAGLIDAAVYHISKFIKIGAKEGFSSAISNITPPAALFSASQQFGADSNSSGGMTSSSSMSTPARYGQGGTSPWQGNVVHRPAPQAMFGSSGQPGAEGGYAAHTPQQYSHIPHMPAVMHHGGAKSE